MNIRHNNDQIKVESPPPGRHNLVIVGAGQPAPALIKLINQLPAQYTCMGLLDPDRALHGTFIEELPVLGWLSDIPPQVNAVLIGTPANPGGFDRKSVYHILQRQGYAMPALQAASSHIADDAVLHPGCILLDRSAVLEQTTLGVNCLLDTEARVGPHTALPAHSVLPAGRHYHAPSCPTRQMEPILASAEDSLQAIIQRINWADMEIILVVDEQGGLTGTVTDGDVRRGLLAGINLDHPVSLIMNRTPITVPINTTQEAMLQLMRQNSIRHLPVVDTHNRPVALERMEQLVDTFSPHDAVIMAGGLGTRLRPLTDDTPKPLLPVGNRPILDHILGGLKQAGIDDVVLSLNYRGEQIRSHVGDGSNHHLHVNYVTEKQRRGTAGALSLLNPRPQRPFLVMNGDLLTTLNYAKLLRFQQDNDYALVMCVRKYRIQVPYGVVSIDAGGCIGELTEKPVHEHFINAGIYVLRPDCLDLIPDNTFFDMTDLVNRLVAAGRSVGAFPIVEYWRDIGRPEDLTAARHQFESMESLV